MFISVISFGLTIPPKKPVDEAACLATHPALRNPIVRLRQEFDTLTFAASGNSSLKSRVAFPACLPEVIAVGATYDYDSDEPFSCDASTFVDQVACFSQSSDLLDLLAPGAQTTTTGIGGVALTTAGTSFFSPAAIGVAALLKEALPGITPDEIVEVLTRTGVPVTDDFDPANVRTTPRVDARAAVLDDDFDLDGCTNGQEFGDNPEHGGVRNPEYFWDFYDVWTHTSGIWERDGFITLFDVMATAARFGPSVYFNPSFYSDPEAEYLANALSPPASETEWNAAYDRGPLIGPNTWDRGPPDGTINIAQDILAVAAQFGHTCG
ncbi:MAG: S8 family serine peptidase [Chloroflexi bacterium]|nr:S8 family serine peptidase [Chloroflexota bacterium]